MALLVDGDQPQQSPDHLLRCARSGRARLGQRQVGPAGQRTLHPTELAHIGWPSSRPPRPTPSASWARVNASRGSASPLSVSATSRATRSSSTSMPASLRRALDHRGQRLPGQWPQHVRPRRQRRHVRHRPGADPETPAAGWPRPAPGRPVPGQQLGEPGPLTGRGLCEQLLELVHHDQQAPRDAARVRPAEAHRPARTRPPAPRAGGERPPPSSPDRAEPGGRRQFPGQRRHRVGARQNRRHRPPARLAGHHRQQPSPDQRRLAAPGRAHDQQYRRLGPFGGERSSSASSSVLSVRPKNTRCWSLRTVANLGKATDRPAIPHPRRHRPAAAPHPAQSSPCPVPVQVDVLDAPLSSGCVTPGSADTGNRRLPRDCAIATSAVHQMDAR